LSPWRLSSSPKLDLRDEGHPPGRAPSRVVIPLDVPRKDGRYLGLVGMPSLSALDFTCLPDSRYLGLG